MIRKYFINEFIHAASGYDPKTYKKDAEKVRLYSTPGIYADYRNRINPKQLGAESLIEVRVKSIQPLDQNTLQIRIARQISQKGQATTTKDELITMGFYFSPNMTLTMEERLINPLGFQVGRYTITEEVFSY